MSFEPKVRLLGGVVFERESGPAVTLSGRPAIAFARLISSSTVVERMALADAIWGEDIPNSWDSALRNTITTLRRAVGDGSDHPSGFGVQAIAPGYFLERPAGYDSDVHLVSRMVAQAESNVASEADPSGEFLSDLAAALAALRELFLGGTTSAWGDDQQRSLDGLRLRGLLAASVLHLRRREFGQAIVWAEEAISLEPTREAAHRAAMAAMLAAGEVAQGLRAYDRCEKILREELGAIPSQETQALYLVLLGSAPSSDAPSHESGPTSVVETPLRRLLPPVPSRLVGRSRERTEVLQLLDTHRLVTLLGLGGIGKTTLAVCVAQDLEKLASEAHEVDFLRDSEVFWIDLTRAQDEEVDWAIARACGFAANANGDPRSAVMNGLGTRRAVLCLDNCETVLDTVKLAVDALLTGCPGVRILATSQLPLDLRAERIFRVGSLDVAPEGVSATEAQEYPAVQLFLKSASEGISGIGPASQLSITDAAEICRLLDGVPFALELTGAMLFEQSAAGIVQRLRDRTFFGDEVNGPEILETRHRSIEASLAWTLESLNERERELLNRLSYFEGSFDVGSISAVWPEVKADEQTKLLLSLVRRSLVTVAKGVQQRRMSVTPLVANLLRSTSDFGDGNAIQESLARHFAAIAELAGRGLQTSHELRFAGVLEGDFENVSAAFRWAVAAGETSMALTICASMFDFAFYRIRLEVGRWAATALEMPGAEQHPLFTEVCAVGAFLAWARTDPIESARLAQLAVDSGGNGWLVHDVLATIALYAGDTTKAASHYERALEIARETQNQYREAIAISQVVFVRFVLGESDLLRLALDGVRSATELGNPTAIANARWGLGTALFNRDPVGAIESFDLAIQEALSVNNLLSEGSARFTAMLIAGTVDRSLDPEVKTDLSALLEQLKYWEGAGHEAHQWLAIREAALLLARPAPRVAARLLAAEASRRFRAPVVLTQQKRLIELWNRLAEVLGLDLMSQLEAEGEILTLAQARQMIRRSVETLNLEEIPG